jgi:hypothetical protein
MTNAQRLYNQTCRHLQAVQANIDRLAFRAAPTPTEETPTEETPTEEERTNFTFIT